ncbi:unnamed protein product, partial [Mesorhabditis spiculigera]
MPQGTLSSSPWRVALSMSLISLPPFAFWCLAVPGPSSLFYLIGNLLALLSVSLTVTKILHYIPSPSIFMYLKLRFQSETLQQTVAVIQIVISLGVLFFYLMFTSSLLSAISKFPFYLLAPLIASLSLLTTVFAGQAMLMLPVFFIFLACLTAGCGIFIYFGLEEVASFSEIVTFQFSFYKIVASLVIGFFMGFYQLAAGQSMYQMYFSLSTRHKLRLCLSLHAAFLVFLSSFTFLIAQIFTHFLQEHCRLSYSAASLLEFIRFTVPRAQFLSFFVSVSLVLLLMFAYQWIFVGLVSTIWEEFLKPHFKEWPQVQQLCALQATALKVTVTLILLSLGVGLSPVSYAKFLPISFYILLSFAALVTGCFACGYFLPFTNLKGCFAGLALCGALIFSTFWANIAKNPLPKLENNCTAHLFDEYQILDDGQHGVFYNTMADFPLDFVPLFLTMVFTLVCVVVSGVSGWQDLFAIDWNLIVWPCCLSNTLSATTFRKRRPFVESDSFRYAQSDASGTGPRPQLH